MNNNKRPLYIPYAGPALLSTPLLNKGSAFTAAERMSFNLEGLLPETTETIQEQVDRAYKQYTSFENDMDKQKEYTKNPSDKNCRWCPFKDKPELCDKKHSSYDISFHNRFISIICFSISCFLLC